MLTRRNFLLCVGALPLAGCRLELSVNRAEQKLTNRKPIKAFAVLAFGYSLPAQRTVDFAKKEYPEHRLISTSSYLAGVRYDEIVVHADVWRSTDSRVVRWVNETLRTRLRPGGKYVELEKVNIHGLSV